MRLQRLALVTDAQRQCVHAMKPPLLLGIQDVRLLEHFCVRLLRVVFVLRRLLLLHSRGDHALVLLRRANHPALFQLLQVHPAGHQCLRPCWHHAAREHQCVLAVSAILRLIAPQCYATCEVRHVLQPQHYLLRCLAQCERGLAHFVRVQKLLLQRQVSHSLALQ